MSEKLSEENRGLEPITVTILLPRDMAVGRDRAQWYIEGALRGWWQQFATEADPIRKMRNAIVTFPARAEARPAPVVDREAVAESTGARAVIRDGKIEISIAIDALPAIVSGSCCCNALDGLWKVTDPAAFAKEVCHVLNNEREDGTTRVHVMFDRAFMHAIEQGAEGIEEATEEEFEAEAARLALLSPVTSPGGGSSGGRVQAAPDGATEGQHSAGWRSICCEGERCFCGRPADRKVAETVFDDDPTGWTSFAGSRAPGRHELTSYVCFDHFVQIMGPAALRIDAIASSPAEGRAGTPATDEPKSSTRLQAEGGE